MASLTRSSTRASVHRVRGRLQERGVVAGGKAAAQARPPERRAHLAVSLWRELEAQLSGQGAALETALGLVAEEGLGLGGAVFEVNDQAGLGRAEDEPSDAAAVDSHRGRRSDGGLDIGSLRSISIGVHCDELSELGGVAGDVQSDGERCNVVDL